MPDTGIIPRRLLLLALRWRIQYRALPHALKARIGISIGIVFIGWIAWRAKFWHHLPTNEWTDVLLGTFLLAIVPFAMAAYGGHIAAEGIADARRRRNVKAIFWFACVIGVGLAFVQQYRSVKQASASQTKTGQVEGAILGQLQSLHNQKPLTATETEAKRREDLMAMLRGQYILEHENVPSAVVEGTEAPPAAWLNERLQQLNENWAVSDAVKPAATIPARSYVAFDGNPEIPPKSGSEVPSSSFVVGALFGFNVKYKATGPNPVQLTEIALACEIASDTNIETEKTLLTKFKSELRKERKTIVTAPQTMMAGEQHFASPIALTETSEHRIVTQDDLDKLKTGAEISYVIGQITYRDAGTVHHLRRCVWLQPPALSPVIWHYCALFNDSD